MANAIPAPACATGGWPGTSRPGHPRRLRRTATSTPGTAGRPAACLTQVHDHLRSELTQIRELLRQVKQGSLDVGRAREALSEMTMRQNNWALGAYCASYCALVAGHHGLEDRAIFPHLRAADPGLAPVIDRLEAEHMVIHEVMQDVDRALVNLVKSPGDYLEVDEAVDVLTEILLSHLRYEEAEITEPLSRFGFYAGQI